MLQSHSGTVWAMILVGAILWTTCLAKISQITSSLVANCSKLWFWDIVSDWPCIFDFTSIENQLPKIDYVEAFTAMPQLLLPRTAAPSEVHDRRSSPLLNVNRKVGNWLRVTVRNLYPRQGTGKGSRWTDEDFHSPHETSFFKNGNLGSVLVFSRISVYRKVSLVDESSKINRYWSVYCERRHRNRERGYIQIDLRYHQIINWFPSRLFFRQHGTQCSKFA